MVVNVNDIHYVFGDFIAKIRIGVAAIILGAELAFILIAEFHHEHKVQTQMYQLIAYNDKVYSFELRNIIVYMRSMNGYGML